MKTWFITGTSKGFGRTWAEEALGRGDQVVATARNLDSIAPLKEQYGDNVLLMTLDVNDKKAVDETINKAFDHFGTIDVVINNAGYGLFAAIEEASEEQVRAQMETNFFGALWVTQAALPYFRKQKSGHFIQVSSVGGVNAFPTLGIYHASKWALEAFSQSLSQEVARFGIKVTLVEPGGYGTDWGTASADHAPQLEEYNFIREYMVSAVEEAGLSVGDPKATGKVILELVDMDQPPLRILFGKSINELMHGEYASRLEEWDRFKALSEKAQG